MSTPTYCDENDVYDESGFDSNIIQTLSGRSVAQVTTLVDKFIVEAEKQINDLLAVPHTVHREFHVGTGEDDEFDLGASDEIGLYTEYDPEDKTVMAYACWFGGIRKKRPYPEDSDQTESIASLCTGTNVTITNDIINEQAGVNCLSMVFSAAGYVRYPSAQNLNKNIDIFHFLSSRVYCSSKTVDITLRLCDKDGNYNYAIFGVDKEDMWYLKHFDLEEEFTGNIDWDDTNLYYWEIHVNGACTLLIDNLNFNHGWFFTAPSGKLVIAHRENEEAPAE
jgi:hypothetical protein